MKYPCSKCEYAATTTSGLKIRVENKHEGDILAHHVNMQQLELFEKKHVVRLPDQRWDADPEEQREKNRLQAQDQLGAPHDAHTIPPME